MDYILCLAIGFGLAKVPNESWKAGYAWVAAQFKKKPEVPTK